MNGGWLEPVPHDLSAVVRLWWVDLDGYAGAVSLDGLGAGEHARAARRASWRDAQRYLASRHALRHLLAGALDRSPESLVIETDEFGKPHFAEGSSLHFNLSHSGHEGLIGVSPDRAIGVDIEVVHPVVDAGPLARAHFTDDELAAWSGAAERLRDRTFLTCWTRKEACVKALGVGLSALPASIEVGCDSDLRAVAVPLGMGRCEVALQSLRLPSDAVAAVALAGPEAVGHARRHFRRP
jgi:4'-phosphopantetheinyl transferase